MKEIRREKERPQNTIMSFAMGRMFVSIRTSSFSGILVALKIESTFQWWREIKLVFGNSKKSDL